MAHQNEITLPEAANLTHGFQNNPVFGNMTKAVSFPKDAITELFEDPLVTGMRFYFAFSVTEGLTAVLVGTDSAGNDVTTKIMNRALKCPPDCAYNSPLM